MQESTEQWKSTIGDIAVNFGLIETVTYEILVAFLSEGLWKILSKESFSKRVVIAKALLNENPIDATKKEALVTLLNQAQEKAKDRNKVLHNTLFINMYKNEEDGEIMLISELTIPKTDERLHFPQVKQIADDIRELSTNLLFEWAELRNICTEHKGLNDQE